MTQALGADWSISLMESLLLSGPRVLIACGTIMRLEARGRSCFSNRYLLTLDGRPLGEYKWRWLRPIEISLTGRRRFELRPGGLMVSRCALVDGSTGAVVAQMERGGFLSRSWKLSLSNGAAELVPVGLLGRSFGVVQSGVTGADVRSTGLCRSGWVIEGGSGLGEADLLFVGLTFHKIVARRASEE